jgi:hypothetical protein
MVTQFDDKGKIFTQIISKKPVTVIIQTNLQMIRGTIHVRPNERVIDELNHSQPFLAVTEAEVMDAQGAPLFASNFLTLNTAQIVWMIPVDEMSAHEA